MPGIPEWGAVGYNHTISFYDAFGGLITTCNCQLTGNAFKCGGCFPAGFSSYQYVEGGVLQVCGNAVALPVELIEFTAAVYNGDVQLLWSTETERDNLEFFLERSADAIEYTFFAAIPGTGNSTIPVSYQSKDTDPLKGISYYRLSQRDFNGAITQLGIVSVEMSGPVSGTLVTPNPSSGTINIQLPLHNNGDLFDVSIVDALGKNVVSCQTSTDRQLDLLPGVYYMIVTRGTQIWQEKLIVAN